MERNKRNSKWRYIERFYDLFSHYGRRTVSARDSRTGRRSSGEHRRGRNHRIHFYHYLTVSLLSVTTPAFAVDDPTVQNSANPVAAATGNVVNQNVNMQNSGAPSRQFFAANNSCNGATAQISPFYMGNDTIPYESDGYVRTNNFGMQISFSVPLDGSMVELCKSIARKQEQKLRLDYELVRALKCTEILKTGFMFRPGSRVDFLCSDLVPIVSIQNGRLQKGDGKPIQSTSQPNN